MKSHKSILLVEDDQVDALTVKRALNDIHVKNHLEIAGNGEEGLSYLRNPGKENPCIILLDLNMPKMSGIEFLKIIKNDNILKKIPVVVLTTSRSEQDKIESFNLGVAGYMLKPVDYQQFVDVIRIINDYWTVSELP